MCLTTLSDYNETAYKLCLHFTHLPLFTLVNTISSSLTHSLGRLKYASMVVSTPDEISVCMICSVSQKPLKVRCGASLVVILVYTRRIPCLQRYHLFCKWEDRLTSHLPFKGFCMTSVVPKVCI